MREILVQKYERQPRKPEERIIHWQPVGEEKIIELERGGTPVGPVVVASSGRKALRLRVARSELGEAVLVRAIDGCLRLVEPNEDGYFSLAQGEYIEVEASSDCRYQIRRE